MSPRAIPKTTVAEYFEIEQAAGDVRHEFYGGDAWAMAGASLRHVELVWRLVEALGPQLRRAGCRGFTNDLRVHVPSCDAYFYPDLVAACGELQLEDGVAPDTLLNPRLIVEILSPSTADIDRGLKSFCYRSISSLAAYVVLEQDRPAGELVLRQDDTTWIVRSLDGADATIEVPSLELSLTLGDLYD